MSFSALVCIVHLYGVIAAQAAIRPNLDTRLRGRDEKPQNPIARA
jgi:hypothetical protein